MFTRALLHAPEEVWHTLAEPEHLSAWFPTEIVGERAAGATLQFEFPERQYPGFGAECSRSTRRVSWSSSGVRTRCASS